MRGVGYRFRPKIEFLVRLLQYKSAQPDGDISGCTEVPGDVSEPDMYGLEKEPWKVFSGANEIRELHDINKRTVKEKYVVAKLHRIGKKNVKRRAGTGTWDDQSTAKPVFIDGLEMGHWRTLTYEYWGEDGAEKDKCYYYMNELHLSEYALNQVIPEEARSKDYCWVICRIIKNENKTCRSRPGSKKRLLAEGQDCPPQKVKKESHNHHHHHLSSATTPYNNPQFYHNNGGHVVVDHNRGYFYGHQDHQSAPVVYNQQQHVTNSSNLGYYSALLHSRDFPELENHGNSDVGCSTSTLPTLPDQQDDLVDNSDWQQYMVAHKDCNN